MNIWGRIICFMLILNTTRSQDVVSVVGQNVVEISGISDQLLYQIRTEVSKVIDQVAYEQIAQPRDPYNQFGASTSKAQLSSVFAKSRQELMQFAEDLYRLYRPLAIWILINPKLALNTKVTYRDKQLYFQDDIYANAEGLTSYADDAAKGTASYADDAAKASTGIWDDFGKSILQVFRRLRKRSYNPAMERHIDNLIREHWNYAQQNVVSLKDRLIFGWRQVIRDVSHQQTQMDRGIMKRSLIGIFSQRLVEALKRALTTNALYESIVRRLLGK
jgi:hypothetical protein